jgi:hypothetical protein
MVAAEHLGTAWTDQLTVAERPGLPHQGNRLFDLLLAPTHLVGKVFSHPDPVRRIVSVRVNAFEPGALSRRPPSSRGPIGTVLSGFGSCPGPAEADLAASTFDCAG